MRCSRFDHSSSLWVLLPAAAQQLPLANKHLKGTVVTVATTGATYDERACESIASADTITQRSDTLEPGDKPKNQEISFCDLVDLIAQYPVSRSW